MSERVFISYRRSDAMYQARLMRFFMKEQEVSVFLDTEINRSQSFPEELERKIKSCEDYVLLVSEDACTYRSASPSGDWLFKEIRFAVEAYQQKKAKNPKGSDMKLHLTAVNAEILSKFIHMEVPDEFKEAHEFICKCTNEQSLLEFEGHSDKQMRSLYATTLQSFECKQSAAPAPGAPVYIQEGEEFERLTIQGELSFAQDQACMADIVKELQTRLGKDSGFNVLDVGCSNGATGRRYFADPNLYDVVVGIDKDADALDEAQRQSRRLGRTFWYREMDVASRSFEDEMQRYIDEWLNGEKFDIIFCCQVLHHIPSNDRSKVIHSLRKFLKKGGCFIIRGSDDATKILYDGQNSHNPIEDIVKLTNKMPTIADRFYGRKIYSELKCNSFEGVVVRPVTSSTSMCPAMEQPDCNAYYSSSFEWRRNIFEPLEHDSDRRRAELETQKNEMEDLLEDLRTKMLFQNNWYMETDFFGYGFKPKR